MNYIDFMKNGGIHIKEENKGKFTDYCGGKVTTECISRGKHSSSAAVRKRATFAESARSWHHEDGGILKAQSGATVLSSYKKVERQSNPDKLIWEDPEDTNTEKETTQEETTTATSTSSDSWIDDYMSALDGNSQTTSATSEATATAQTSTPSYSPGDPLEKRGFRNNNWLNIRKSDNAWQGKIQNGSDNSFEQFETPELGIRAAAKNIKTYASRGKNTIRDIISTWAPTTENDTNSYITNVSSRMGVNPDQIIDVNDQNTMVKLLSAMTISENGREGDIDVIRRGVAMA